MSDPIPVLNAVQCIAEPQTRSTRSTNVVYDQWVNQLAPLASQHHLSEYSRMKHVHQGSPVAYTPLSLHLPDVVRDLRRRQEKYADQVLWWPCGSSTDQGSSPITPAEKQCATLSAGDTVPHPDLQQELCDALSEPMLNRFQSHHRFNSSSHQKATKSSATLLKTSESHPINISAMIPPESLIAISSHLIPCTKSFPVLFEVHAPYTLDRITGYAQLLPSLQDSSYLIPSMMSTILPSISSQKHSTPNEMRSSVTDALHAALNTKISLPPLSIPASKILMSLKRVSKVQTAEETRESGVLGTIPVFVSSPPQPSHRSSDSVCRSVLDLPNTVGLTCPQIRTPTISTLSKGFLRHRASLSFRRVSSSRPPASTKLPFKLGNLLLSSCPGKKVRLNGPVRGRSAVCRDIVIDLRRIKNLGARCVICCLDDEELEFLIGTSWSEYCQAAHREGLDVLRVPVPEGLVPLSPESLDADLYRIIDRYTLQGATVLVHCRGGVGRAGLLACCWILKLGLCGWIETDVPLDTSTASRDAEIKGEVAQIESFKWESDTVVHRDTLQLVERVIGIVRRRRSVKAVETMEQVKFLVEYVDYLRRSGHLSRDLSDSERT